MPELMKDQFFNHHSIHQLALDIKAVYPPFQQEDFMADVMDETWAELELKTRMRKISVTLGKYLPPDYPQALSVMDQVVGGFSQGHYDFVLLCFPDFVEVFGQEDCYFQLSIDALERYTPFSTSEFAVRPFIIRHQTRMMEQMALWARHDNEHVRRLASEGCRPSLPWGQALNSFKKDPAPVLWILEQLKADPSLYVRKSVANNLNDISKTHPQLVAQIAKDWYGNNKNTDWIVKHGCRTLLKKGNRDVLEIFGFSDVDGVEVDGFKLDKGSVMIGEALTFSFEVLSKKAAKVRLEYGIDYVKANGKRNRKIFQISESTLKEDQESRYTKTHSFAELTTRKHYPGTHAITLIVNGAERGTLEFQVLASKEG